MKHLQRTFCFLINLLGIWCISDDMSPSEIVDKAIKRWGNPATAFGHLLQSQPSATNELYASCILWSRIESNDPLSNLHILRTLLERLPAQQRAEALAFSTNNDPSYAAYILTQFLPNVPYGLDPVAKYIVALWSAAPRYDDLALNFYQSLTTYGIPVEEMQWVIARALLTRGLYSQAEPLLLDLARIHPSPDLWWHLAHVFQVLRRPTQYLLDVLYHFIKSAPWDARARQALQEIGDLYSERHLDGRAKVENSQYLKALRAILEIYPEQNRPDVLALVTNRDDSFTASILSSLTPPVPAGLTSIAYAIMNRWTGTLRNDDLALRFYYALPGYGIPPGVAYIHLARSLIARRLYIQAEDLLHRLAQQYPSPDVLCLLAIVYQLLDRSPHLQLETLQRFIKIAPSDPRVRQAWKMIGDLYGERLSDGMEAVRAYEHAEELEVELKIPQLSAFRAGDWDAIPALSAHPDYLFPVTVAVDLEPDPNQHAKYGERVFEVAAVRMRGNTILLVYQSFIRRPFRPAKMQSRDVLEHAPQQRQVAAELREFIGESLVIGHNLRDFDAKELEGMEVLIPNDQIVDTLTFARLIYPDSPRHYLALLCDVLGVKNDGEWHTALADARACGRLLYVLGNELAKRGDAFLNGFRALVRAGSAFDQAVLQPRDLSANPMLSWSLDPNPSVPRIIASLQELPASPAMQMALQDMGDTLVELVDPEAAYIKYLPADRRVLVTASIRARIEKMLASQGQREDIYVLADPRTLLCPQRLRSLIESSTDSEYQLLLFCLYQASHNHDAGTLYPMRLDPGDDPTLLRLRRDLMRACCSTDMSHSAACPAIQAHLATIDSHDLLLATHEALVHQDQTPRADTIIIDDAAELQMHLAEYRARCLRSEIVDLVNLEAPEQQALADLWEQIAACAKAYAPQPGFHERLPLQSVARFLMQPHSSQTESVYAHLNRSGTNGMRLAEIIQKLCEESTQDPIQQNQRKDIPQEEILSNRVVHAHWLDLWFTGDTDIVTIERWAICGLSEDLGRTFLQKFWQPYSKRILCGTALTVREHNTTFLERYFNLPKGLPVLKDERPQTQLYVPTADTLQPSGFLCRMSWAMQVGALLYSLQEDMQDGSLLITLNHKAITEALAEAFKLTKPTLKRQVLATQFGWTTTKIGERLAQPERSVIALVSPRVRLTHLDIPVDVEVTGPLRFLSTQDPLVAAHMRIFEDLYDEEGPFMAYLLPQALLELKTRLSSRANLHIVLDSRLHSRVYHDETFAMLNEMAFIREVPWQSKVSNEGQEMLKAFLSLLTQQLEHHGFSAQEDISDQELRLVLRKFWDTDDFKPFPVEDASKPVVTQKEIVRALLHGKDQLLIAATGGGKSLCFQLPALLLTDQEPPKVTLIFSPLISLMSDQVEALRQKGVFSAITLNSSLSTIQRQEHLRGLMRGEYSIVYIAPEQIRSSGLRRALEGREIGLIAVDEAHCLSQWGHDFRTDYFAVKDWIERLCGKTGRQFPILALTATARKGYIDLEEYERSDQTSTLHDIIEKLDLKIGEEEAVIASPQRNELEFHVEHIVPPPQKCKCGEVLELKIGQVKCRKCHTIHRIDEQVNNVVEQMKFDRLVHLLTELGPTGLRSRWDQHLGKRQRGIVYCAYISTAERVAKRLRRSVPGLRVGLYHSEVEPEEKDEVLRRFKSDHQDGLDVVVATNAFGMGIDIRRLGFVIHFDVSGTPEAYYQEAGRAGRDQLFTMGQERAMCILLYHTTDLNKQSYLSRKNRITRYQIEDVYDVLCELRRDMENPSEEQPASAEMKHEVIFTAQDIATRAGVSEEQIGMILYYLEYHTQLHGNPNLRRGETAHSILQVKFERGYQEQIQLLPENSPSRPLLECFLHSDIFGLNEDAMTTTTISLKELAEHLGWFIPKLERELLNLVQRRIVAYVCQGRITWTSDPAHAREVLTNLAKNIETLLREIDTKRSGALFQGETVFEDLIEVCTKHKLNAVPFTYLLHFLSALSHKEANELRLFKRFVRVVRRSHAGRFEMRLYTEHNCIPLERLGHIFDELINTLSLVEQHVKDTQQEFDLLKLRPHYAHRQRLHRQLLLLDVLGLLKYTSDPSIGLAMRVAFQQPYAPRDQIEIDLKSLRLKETYDKHKLKLMERYATETQQETRAESFNTYFFGRNPLVEHIDQAIRADLTAQQQDLTKLTGGIHLIEGPAGCGKTTVLVEYIKHLVYQRQVPIERIMVTTHYKSATHRIAKALEVLQEDGSLALATTINSFGEMIFKKYRLQLLRSDGLPYYEKEPQLLSGNPSAVQQKELSLVNKALTSIYAGTWQKVPWPADLELPSVSGAYQPNDELERQCFDAIKRLREQGVFPLSSTSVNKEQIKVILGKAKDTQCPLSLLYAVYHVFLQLKGRENTYTFDDQVLIALAILRSNPTITKEYSHFFEYIIVDELQDFTPAQAHLFLQLSTVQHNVMCFGDRDQAIRVKEIGATSIFEGFARMDSCGQGNAHQLTTNFRSTQRILDLVSYVRDFQESRKRPPLKSALEENGEFPVLLRIGTDDELLFSNHGLVGIQAETTPMKVMVQAALELIQRIPEPERGSTALIVLKSNRHLEVVNYLRSCGENFSILNNQPLYQQHHVNRILVYLRLIVNPGHDHDIEQLLRFCLVPYFEDQQVKTLKELARQAKVPLIRVLQLEKALRRANITREQESALQQHLAVIAGFQSDSLVSQVEEALWAIDNGPFAILVEEEQKLDDVKEVLRHLRHKTISEAVAEIKQHLSFLEEEQKHTGLIVTTIDHAKSEEFDTVFLLGADYLGGSPNPGNLLSYKRRLYVGISRARKRLFLVVGEHGVTNPLFSSIPKHLNKEVIWSPMVYQAR